MVRPKLHKSLSLPAQTLFKKVISEPTSFRQADRNGLASTLRQQIKDLTNTTLEMGFRSGGIRRATGMAAMELAVFYPTFRVRQKAQSWIMEFAKITKQDILDTRSILYSQNEAPDPEFFTPNSAETAIAITFIKGLPTSQLRQGTSILQYLVDSFATANPNSVETILKDASFQEWRFLYLPEDTQQMISQENNLLSPPTVIDPATKTIPELDATVQPSNPTSHEVIKSRKHIDFLKAGDLLNKEGRVAFFALLGADVDQPMLLRANAVKEIGKIRGDYEQKKGHSTKPINVIIAGQQQVVSLNDSDEVETTMLPEQPVIELVQ